MILTTTPCTPARGRVRHTKVRLARGGCHGSKVMVGGGGAHGQLISPCVCAAGDNVDGGSTKSLVCTNIRPSKSSEVSGPVGVEPAGPCRHGPPPKARCTEECCESVVEVVAGSRPGKGRVAYLAGGVSWSLPEALSCAAPAGRWRRRACSGCRRSTSGSTRSRSRTSSHEATSLVPRADARDLLLAFCATNG